MKVRSLAGTGGYPNMTGVLITERDPKGVGEPRKDCIRPQKGGDHQQAKKRETRSAGTLISDLQPPEPEKMNFCCLNPPVFGILWRSP